MILMQAVCIVKAIGRGGTRLLIAISGPKKVSISGPTHSNGWSNGFARIKTIKSKRHIKNRYFGNFM